MARNNFLDTQTGGSSNILNDVTAEESQNIDLSPKEAKEKEKVEEEVEKEVEKTAENLSVEDKPKEVDGDQASKYIPVSESSLNEDIPTSADNSTAKQLLDGGKVELEESQKIFNRLDGIEQIHKEAEQNIKPPSVDVKMDDLMSENNVFIKNLNVDHSSVFDREKIKSLKTTSKKIKNEFGDISDIVEPIYDIDEETEEDLITVTGVKVDTELDKEIYENRRENKSNSLISEGTDGVYRYDIGRDENQNGVSAGGPTEEAEPGPNGYYTMKGKVYYKNKNGDWYKLYPKDKKSVRKNGYDTYNSSWIKMDDPRRIRAVESKSQFQTYRDVRDKSLIDVSNDQIRRAQEAYGDPFADLSGDTQLQEEVSVVAGLQGPWGYEDEMSREDAIDKIGGKEKSGFLQNGDYRFAGKDYIKKNGKWFYRNEKGSVESIYGKDKQIIKLERSAIPKSLLRGKNTAFIDVVQGISNIDVSEIMVSVAEKVEDWWQGGAKGKVINGFDWIKNIAARSNPDIINNQAREIALDISRKWTSGTLTEAEYELMRSFGVLRDEYLNYGENKAIFEESYGDLGNIWRSPDKKKDLIGGLYKGEMKAGMEMIAFLANGGTMTKNIKGDGIYHVGGDYLMKRGGRWMNFDGTIVEDKGIIEVFNSAGRPGVFDFTDIMSINMQEMGIGSSSIDPAIAMGKDVKDLTLGEEISLMLNGRQSIVKETDLYNMYKSNSIVSMLIDENLKSAGLGGSLLIDLLNNPNDASDNIDLIRKKKRGSVLDVFENSNKSINEAVKSISRALNDFNDFENDKQRIKWFSENSFVESGLTDEQRKIIEAAQEDASNLIDDLNTSTFTMERLERSDLMRKLNFSTQKNRISEFVSQIDQLVLLSNQVNETNNQIKSSGKSPDLIFFNRKNSYLRKFSTYLPGSLTENQGSAMELFTQKKNLAEYVLDLEQNGMISISKEGKLSYTDKASRMGEDYVNKLENKISDLNGMVDIKRNQCIDENIAEKAELEASIRNTDVLLYKEFERLIDSETSEEYAGAVTRIERLEQTKEVNEAKLDQIKTNNYTVFLTGGEEMAEDLMSGVTEGFFNPYLAALEGVSEYSAKNKFDLIFEQMSDRMIDLVNSEKVDVSFSGDVLSSVKDLLAWDGWLELSAEEKEYYQLAKTLKASLPLYLNNEYSFEGKDTGFFNSLFGTFYSTAFPNKAGAKNSFGLDMDIESSQAKSVLGVVQSGGFTAEDVTEFKKLKELEDKSKEESDLMSWQFTGQIMGGSVFYLGTIPMGGWVTGGLFKSAVAVQKLTVGAKGLTIAEKTYNAIPRIYMNTLGTTKLGRFLKQPFYTAYMFERAGTVFGAAEEEMTALGGFMGGAGVATFQLLGKKVSQTAFNKFAKALFTKGGKESASTWNQLTSGFQIGAGFGSGEVVEETMQVFAKAFNAMDDTKKMYEVLEQSFGSYDRIMKHIVGSFAMGALFGFAASSKTKSMYEGLDSESRAKVDKAVKQISEELNASMESTEEYISGQKKKISNIEKNSILDDSKDTEGVSSEEQVGQESVQEESIEETSKEKVGTDRVVQEEQVETKEEGSKIENEEQAKQEEQAKKDSKVEYEALSEKEQSGFKQKAKQELEAEKTKGKVTEEQINKRAEEIYAKDGLRINIGKNANQAKGQRVTVTVNKDSEYGGVDMDITDEFGNNIGNVRGTYDADGNFDVEEISIVEGKRGQQYATETISVINENTNNNVIVSGNTESTEALGQSLENGLQATQDSDGNYVVNNTTENIEANEDATIEYKEDLSAADKIRSMKIGSDSQVTTDENGNPIPAPKKNSLNFFDAAWNASVEAAAQVAEKGGSLYKTLSTAKAKFKKTAFYQSFETTAEKDEQLAKFVIALEEQLGTEEFSKAEKALKSLKIKAIKKFRESAYYQGLKPRSKARKEALIEFEEKLENDTDRILSEKMKKKEVLDLDKMVGEYSAEQRQSQGPLDLKLSIAEKIKANKSSDLGVIKQEIIQYIKKALPESNYTKAKLVSLINSVENAKTIATAQKVFNKVDNISKKDYDTKRKEAYKEAYTRVNTSKKGSIIEQMTYKSGKQRMSTESIKAYNEFLKNNDLSQAALENMSLEELVLINNTLSEIVETGKVDQKSINEQKENIRRDRQGKILESFPRLKDKKKVMTAEEVLNPEAVFRGSFVIDGKYFSPSEAKAYIKKQTKEGVPPTSINFFKSVDMDYDVSTGIRSNILNSTGLNLSDFSYKLKRLYAGKMGVLSKGYKGNQELKNLSDKIDRGVKWAYALEQQDNGKFQDELNNHLNKVFGKGVSERVGQATGVSSVLSSELKSSPKNTDQFFVEGRFEGKKRKITNDKLIDLYLYGKDPTNDYEARKSLSVDFDMDAVDAYVNSNPNLLNHAEWIENQYNEIAKNKYGNVLSKYKGNFDIETRDGYYYPRNVKKEGQQTTEEAAAQMVKDAGGDLRALLISNDTVSNAHVKARTGLGNSELINIGATQKLMNYVQGMNHVQHFYETAVDIGMITNNKAISDAIVLSGGKNALTSFKQHASLILGGEQTGSGMIKAKNTAVDYLSTAAVIKTLGMSTKNIPKQLSSSLHWLTAGIKYGVGPVKATINTVANTFTRKKGQTDEEYANMIDVARTIMNSQFVRDRWKGMSIDESLNNVIAEAQGDGALKRMISKGSKFALLYTRLGDMGGVVLGGIPFTYNLYSQYRKSEADGGRGMNHEEALQAAYVAFTSETNDIQQSSRGDHKSLSQRSAVVKALTMYTTSQQAIIKKTMNAYKTLTSRTKLSQEEKAQAIVDLIYYPTFGNLIFNAVASGYITGMFGLDDEEDPEARERLKFDVITDSTIGGNLQGMGPLNLISGVIFNTMKDREAFNNLPFHENLKKMVKEGFDSYNYLSGTDSYVNIEGINLSVDTDFKEISKKENQEVIKSLVKESESIVSEKLYNKILKNDWDSWTGADMAKVETLWNERVTIAKDASVLDRLQEMAFPERGTLAEAYDAITDGDIEAVMKEVSKGVLEFGLGEEAVEFLVQNNIDGFVRKFSGWPQQGENQLADRVATKLTPLEELSGKEIGKTRSNLATEKGDNILWDAWQAVKGLVSEAEYEPYMLKRWIQAGYYEAKGENQKTFREYLQKVEGLSQHEVNTIANNDEERMNEFWTKHINYGIKYQENKAKGKDKKINTGGTKVKGTKVKGTKVEGTKVKGRIINP